MGDEKPETNYVEREVRRLSLSIDDANEKEKKAQRPLTRVVAVHFPPLYANALETEFSKVIEAWKPAVCVYGHLHGPGIPAGFTGERAGLKYVLASCDAAGFSPVQLLES